MSISSTLRGARAWSQTPLYRNGLALAINSSLSALLGAGYWAVAAHHASQATVGRASALVAALLALSAISQLSLPNVLTSYLPRTRESARWLVLRAYGIAAGLGICLGGGFALIAPRVSENFTALSQPGAAIAFSAAVAMWTVFALQDNALTGLRRAVWVPIENVVYSATKLAALIGLGSGVGVMALLGTWVVPAAIAVLPVSGILLLRLLPAHARTAGSNDLTGIRAYFAADATGLVLTQVAITMMPVLVVLRLGAREAGAFSVAWMLAQSLDLVAVNLGMSLVVEGAHDPARLPGLLRGLRRKTLTLVVVLVAGGVVLAPHILAVFGSSYAREGSPVLRFVLLGSIGRAVTVLALCAARARRHSSRILTIQLMLGLSVPVASWLFAGWLGLVGVGVAWAAVQSAVGLFSLATEPPERASQAASAEVRTILCVNHWHDDNKGDSAITSGLLDLVHGCWPEAVLRVATLNEPSTPYASSQLRHIKSGHTIHELHSLAPTEFGRAGAHGSVSPEAAVRWLVRIAGAFAESLTGRPRKVTRRMLHDVDLVVMVGGSNIYDDPDVLAPMSLARLFQVLYPAWAAGTMSIPTILAGHTLGPMRRRSARWLAARMLKRTTRTLLREETSRELAATLGLRNVVVRPDLAFATEPRRSAKVALLMQQTTPPLSRTAALVVRQHPHLGQDADSRLVDAFVAAARQLLDEGLFDGLLVVPHTVGPTPIEDDRGISAELVARLGDAPVTVLDQDFGSDELAEVYGACAVVIAVRLHAAILALSQGTPAFAVAYMTRKTEGVMTDAGLPYAWCAFDQASGELIVEAVRRLMADGVRQEVTEQSRTWRESLRTEVQSWRTQLEGETI